MTQEIYDEWKRWTSFPLEDQDLREELLLLDKDPIHLEEEVSDRFYKELEFGTGGLRGVIGAGSNRMNIYTVARATQGYGKYLKKSGGTSIVIAYDSRIKSKLFAQTAAEVLAASGMQVYIFQELMPTPILSFAIRYLRCDGGIVITASHNPARYNGYKVYGKSGEQITSAVAGTILEEIRKVDIFEGVQRLEFEQAMETGMISYVSDDVMQKYLMAVSKEGFEETGDKDLSIIYTPLNGTGLRWVQSALGMNGFKNITLVKEQCDPDGNFPTCKTPNPEKKEALQLGIEYALRQNGDLVLATDPDCDRVGAAVRTEAGYRLLSGNEIGVLLLDYVCRRRIAAGTMPERPLCIKTIVTTDLAYKVGASYGVEIRDVLTGFKYIGEQIGILEQREEMSRFILGIEESHGYLSGTYVRDKDGVNASLLICEMAEYYRQKGLNLIDGLELIYEKFGYCLNSQETFLFEGAAGAAKMNTIMQRVRYDWRKLPVGAGMEPERMSDYWISQVYGADGSQEKINLPQSNVCKLVWKDGSSLVVRPSGTEPKLKVYLSVSGDTREEAEERKTVLAEGIKNYIGSI